MTSGNSSRNTEPSKVSALSKRTLSPTPLSNTRMPRMLTKLLTRTIYLLTVEIVFTLVSALSLFDLNIK